MLSDKEFIFLITGRTGNDNAAIAWSRKNLPETTIQVFRLPYEAPYNKFTGIKLFQQQITMFKPFVDTRRAKAVILDMHEWIGHENEEYLSAFLAYLHDYHGYFDFRFVVTPGNTRKEKAESLYKVFSLYLPGGQWIELKHRVSELLDDYNLEPEVKKMLNETIGDSTLPEPQIRMVIEDLLKKVTHRGNLGLKDMINAKDTALKETKLMLFYDKPVRAWLGAVKRIESKGEELAA